MSVELNEMLLLVVVMLLVAVKLTGLGKVKTFAPLTVILLPIWIKAALVKVRLVKGFGLPTAPLNEIFPTVPARKAKANAPLSVLEKLIVAPVAVPPPFVLSKVVVVV